MKIKNYKLFLVPPRWLFLKIETDEGMTGWGEPVVEGKAATVKAAVENLYGKSHWQRSDGYRRSLEHHVSRWILSWRPGFYERYLRHRPGFVGYKRQIF